LGGELTVGGTVSFHWVYTPGDSAPVEADFRWDDATPPPLAQGVGDSQNGNFSTFISPGTTNLEFLLTSTLLSSGKLSATLVITDFQFLDIPEPCSGALFASMLTCLGAARWRRSRRRASGQR
jgi:hypothetical protein